jgi:hypothetical protein
LTSFLPWWERYPGRLEFEIAALSELGIGSERDEQAWEEDLLRLRLVVPDRFTGLGELELTATFPEFYPYLRPEVQAVGLALPHHQHPFGKNLCIVGRSTRYWESGDTLAGILEANLRTVLTAGSGAAVGEGDEEDQGEPFSDYYRGISQSNAVVLVDSDWEVAVGAKGNATLYVAGDLPPANDAHTLVVVEQLFDADNIVAAMPVEVVDLYTSCPKVDARWVMLHGAVQSDDPSEIWAAAAAADHVEAPSYSDDKKRVELRLVGFPEEHGRQGLGVGWILVVKVQLAGRPTREERRSGNPQKRASSAWMSPTFDVVRAGRVGRGDMEARAPGAVALRDKRVAVIGCGAIGSVVVDQLSRAGVGGLVLVDPDHLEPGNLSRHAATMGQVGLPKAAALAIHAVKVNPFVGVESQKFQLGGMGAGQRQSVAAMLDSVDLVVDATAEVAVQELSASLAAEALKPWVMLEGTNGGWGGAVVSIPAGAEWCFACYERHLADGTVPRAPADTAAPIQPAGCADPTFSAAQYDLAEVSLQAVRAAVQLLGDGPQPPNLAVVSMTTGGQRTPPQWSTATMAPHAECACGAS